MIGDMRPIDLTVFFVRGSTCEKIRFLGSTLLYCANQRFGFKSGSLLAGDSSARTVLSPKMRVVQRRRIPIRVDQMLHGFPRAGRLRARSQCSHHRGN
jgi:hypothetical protein